MANTYCITTCSEATDWKRIIVAEFQTATAIDALEAYYHQHHDGKPVVLNRAFMTRGITIDGVRYTAFTKQFLGRFD